ncbi:MAG: tetratricopeptide repeat protein [Alphaproteobacteria bacterium]|nr:tetratricopeptide repeat protein [Alphaproteobacteria bacterium]
MRQAVERALALHRAGSLAEAEAGYRAAVERWPDSADGWQLLGVLLLQRGDPAAAVAALDRAIGLRGDQPGWHLNRGEALRRLGRLAESEAAFRRVLVLRPDHVDAAINLGLTLHQAGRFEDSLAVLEPLRARRPGQIEVLQPLAGSLLNLRRGPEAVALFREAAALAPNDARVLSNLGNALTMTGQAAEAETVLKRAVSFDPRLVPAWCNLGNALRSQGLSAEAIEAFRKALALVPAFFEAWLNLGTAYQDQGDLPAAVEAAEKAIALRPEATAAWNNLGSAKQDLGDLDGATAAFRKVLEREPDNAIAHTNLIFTLDFDPRRDAEALQAERKAFDRAHCARFASAIAPHDNARDPERKLRIGYVSPFFRRHSSALAFAPVIFAADRSRYETVCYSGTVVEDAMTQRFKDCSALWRSTVGVSDQALADTVRADGIDILVDCVGHMGGNRLPAFGRKPAPVQITAWGQCNGTGLAAIDALFVDPILLPAEERHHYAERAVDLPCCIAYLPPDDAPDPVPPPAAKEGAITFGVFNRLSKATPDALVLWAEVLKAVPGSRLVLKSRGMDSPPIVDRLRGVFAGHGVDPDRLSFRGDTPPADHLAAHGAIDIALDPVPQGGGISSIDALWMGVPVVTLMGRSIAGRPTAAILATLGLGEWIAKDAAGYVAIARDLAEDRDRLAALRQSLRPRLQAHPLCNPPLYARAVEAAYRDLWRGWCIGPT